MKSNVSDQLDLVYCIYKDACTLCIADVSDFRDLSYIRSRLENEGMSFLTITLPNFASDFERALANGQIDSTMFQGFRKIGSIPAFLQGMTSHVFEKETGRIYNEIPPQQLSPFVDAIRQICLSYKKVVLPCTPEREYMALQRFIENEHDFNEFSLREEDQSHFRTVSSVLWDTMVSRFRLADCTPRHGPGATSEGVSGNQKFSWSEWNDRLEPYFPLVGTGYPLGISTASEEFEKVTIIPQEEERPVRVVLVPKTLKSPRVIAIEPCCMQFVQQGIRDLLYKGLESSRYSKGHINFRDQSINQELALTSSSTGRLATIDLSDASDRVPRDLALEMFRCNPDFQDAIDACRSTKALLPDGREIDSLKKFASMGSALCFPIEAMYFYTICVVALLRLQNLPATPRNVYKVSRSVYVYGDDIIVPTTYAIGILDYLQRYNCKVNPNKTFVSGNFRESCGMDAYGGERVTPVYLRHMFPKDTRQHDAIVSWVATSNLFYKKGFWNTALFMRKRIERLLGPLPYVSEDSSVVGHYSYLGYVSVSRWNRDLQSFEIRGLVPEPVYRSDKLDGYGALSKSLRRLEASFDQGLRFPVLSEEEGIVSPMGGVRTVPLSQDPLHLERSARRGVVALKRRWAPATI